MAFAMFAVLIAVMVILIVTMGQWPGQIAAKRGHPQAGGGHGIGSIEQELRRR